MTSKRSPRKSKKKGKEVLAAPRGMHDILPAEWPWWDKVYSVSEKLAYTYNFKRIETPILEHAALFKKGVGEETDIVQKEMFAVRTKGGDALVLRPEGTAGIARAYAEHRLDKVRSVQKLWHMSPMFRHERPQAGRFRQFWQIGIEVMGGTSDPFYDAHVILIFQRLLEGLKIKNIVLKINSIGCRTCRPSYVKELEKHYKKRIKELCKNCEKRLKTNPLRLLDCKKEQCASLAECGPNVLDKLCSTCSKHFTAVLEHLDEVEIPYVLDNCLVRGLDYYSRTVFEFYVHGEGEEMRALPAGGRYDYLFEMLGAKTAPAVGGAVGVERLIEVMKLQGVPPPPDRERRVFLIHVGEAAKRKMFRVMEELRVNGIAIAESLSRESLSSQLKIADREGAKLALILGQKEIFEDSIIIRNLKESTQETVPLRIMAREVKKRLR